MVQAIQDRGIVVIDEIDAFKKEESKSDKPLRFPVQDIYKFTEHNDDAFVKPKEVIKFL